MNLKEEKKFTDNKQSTVEGPFYVSVLVGQKKFDLKCKRANAESTLKTAKNSIFKTAEIFCEKVWNYLTA
ncbi:MAG: hypothetical protein COB50_02430 [Thiotrichales bacterium]|nr:MAG: hypothetical protein COB50_02430 [Thiotrichales bacterium]